MSDFNPEYVKRIQAELSSVNGHLTALQARVKELEELRALVHKHFYVCGRPTHELSVWLLRNPVTTTPDTSLQRKVLKARIDEQMHFTEQDNTGRQNELRAQLASLNRNETLGEC